MKKIIGYCGVDSGQLVIGDPCYFKNWKDGNSTDLSSSYGQACKRTLTKEGGGEMIISPPFGNGVAFSTGGDGNFPVYANYRKNGSISSITIKL